MTFDFAAYLDRIGLASATPDIDGLRQLQQAQMRSIPFENFDPLLGLVPKLDLGDIFAKTVIGRRGGYCFELNSLFGAALRAAGFEPRRLLARVRMRTGPEAPRSHLVQRVEIQGRVYLADAGFGGPGPLMPIDLLHEGEQEAPNGIFRVVYDAERSETVLERFGREGWFELYAFDDARVSDGEVAVANYTCATWDEAPFVGHAMLGAYRDNIRYGVFDRWVTVERGSEEERREIADLDGFVALVRDEMGICLSAQELTLAWEKIRFA